MKKNQSRQRAVADAPDEKMHDIVVHILVGKEKRALAFRSNITQDSVNAVVTNWMFRTEDHTADSLIEYINSKSHYGYKAEPAHTHEKKTRI